jgi:hypothetical protein
MHSIIFNAPDVLMGRPVINALVNVVTYVPWWKVMAEIMVCPLIDFLVVTVMVLTTLTGISITVVVVLLLIAVVVIISSVGAA